MPRSLESVLEFIENFWRENHYSPSSRDIADHFKTSTSIADRYLRQLELRGLIEPRIEKLSRVIMPVSLGQVIEKFFVDDNEKTE